VYTGCRWGSAAAVVDMEVNKEVVDTEDILMMARSGGGGGGGGKNMEMEVQVCCHRIHSA
jgi:hypothetical protein